MRKMLIIGMGILFLCSGALSATIINIPTNYSTIQQGIDASQDSDTVLVHPGTYYEHLNYNGKNITVSSLFLTTQDTSYISQTIIDGNQEGRILTLSSGEDTTAVFCGFTTQNGIAGNGGAIFCNESAAKLSHLKVLNNTANGSYSKGGGICIYDSYVILENSYIMNNHTGWSGGGICVYYFADLYMTNTKIYSNTCDLMGGGISCDSYSDATICNSEINNNNSTALYNAVGGGIFSRRGDLFLNNVLICGNYAGRQGGGLCFGYDGNLNLSNVVIKNNVAESDGGGIMGKYRDFNMENVTIHENTADWGGGMYLRDLNVTMENVGIISNTASEKGGGIYFDEVISQFTNSKIANNSADELGGGIYIKESLINFNQYSNTIYLNEVLSNKGSGSELYAEECPIISVVVDTFSVINPTDFYASPRDNFIFDIQYGLLDSLINADMYVSVNGNNSNTGITPDQPFKTISYALSRIYSDSLNHNTIHLEPGVYSPTTNGEQYPLHWISYVSLHGAGQDSTILDVDTLGIGIQVYNAFDVIIQNLSIQRAKTYAILSNNSTISINNVSFENNLITISYSGCALKAESSDIIVDNTLISNNEIGGIWTTTNSTVILSNSHIINSIGNNSGALSFSSTDFQINNVIVEDCSARRRAGLSAWSCEGEIKNSIFRYNTTLEDEGTIVLTDTQCDFENVQIMNNTAYDGGALYLDNSNITLKNTTIKNNEASNICGGIYSYESTIEFDPTMLCNIYSNTATYKGSGKDIFAQYCNPIHVIVDTFTIVNPSDYYASPIDMFTFDIIHGKQDSLINADLYVAVNGDNSNSGLCAADPLKTIEFALSKIYADSLNHNNILLAPGVYSHYTNGEIFPLEMSSHVTITGSSPEEVILDADSLSNIFNFSNVSQGQLYNITIQNGVAEKGGGINISNSTPMIRNVIFRYNHAYKGGAIYSYNDSHPQILNCTFYHCSSSDDGGALWCNEILLDHCLFYENIVGNYGIILCEDTTPFSTISNITMTDNTGLAFQANYGYIEIINSILWNDSSSEIWGYYTNDIHVSYSDIQGGYGGTGNISTYPLFNDPSNNDYRLKWSHFPYSDSTKSPCIDKGNPNTIYFDPDGTRNDMGYTPFFQTPYGTISGQVTLNGPFGNVDKVLITADTMFTYPDEGGLYTLPMWTGTYDVKASHARYQDSIQVGVPIYAWITTSGINFDLQLEHQGPIWHIATDGSDSTGTGSLQHPFFSIQQGINIASENDTILIHPGVYHECINYNEKAITVASEFIVDNDPSYIFQTIIDGDSLGRVVTMTNSGNNNQYLTGLTIKNGNHSSGAGICCMSSNSILSNLIIQDCIAQIDGGGLLLASSQVEISKVKIVSCSAYNKGGGMRTASSSTVAENMSLINCCASYGGAIYDNNSNLCFSNIDMINNEAQEYGGAFFSISSVIDINNAIVQDNFADSIGGALYTHSSDVVITNSILTRNNSSIGGGIYSDNSNYNIFNTTLYGNNNVGIYCTNQSEVNVINDILWQNNPQQIEANNANVIIEYSDIENGYTGTGNINAYPQFINPDSLNLRFLDTSPCINTGTPDTTGLHLSPWDLDGNPRIYDGRIDMGAYEWQGVGVDDPDNYEEVILHQNFPNPFSTSTQISFSLPHPEKVRIQVYNLKGQLVETLLDEDKPSGEHSVELYADEMSSGIYFMKLLTKERDIVRKLVIIK
jgi:hypothetical protein